MQSGAGDLNTLTVIIVKNNASNEDLFQENCIKKFSVIPDCVPNETLSYFLKKLETKRAYCETML